MTKRYWLPWYRIGWNLLWVPVIYTGRFLFVFGVGMILGIQGLKDAWRDTA